MTTGPTPTGPPDEGDADRAGAVDGQDVMVGVPPVDEPGVVVVARRSLGRAGLIVAAAMALGNAGNYLFQVVMSRLLGPSSYGALGALLAVSFIVSVPGLALQTVVARHTALRDREGRSVDDLWSGVLGAVVVIGLVLMGAAFAASLVVERFLHLASVGPALWLGVALLALPVLPAVLGMLQGRERFTELGASLLVAALAKLAFGWALVALGFGVSGALAGAAIGSILGAILGVVWARPRFVRARMRRDVLREIRSAGLAIFGLFLVVNLDIVLARHFLPRKVSGLYAVGSIVAKVAYWAPRFVIVVIFPRLAIGIDRRMLLGRALAVVLGFSLVVVGAVGVGSHWLLGNVFGGAYVGIGSSLWLFAGIGTAFALVQLLLFSGIAAADSRMSRALGIAVVVKTTLIVTVFHRSVAQIATVVLFTAVALLAVGLLLEYRRGPGERTAPSTPRRLGRLRRGQVPADV